MRTEKNGFYRNIRCNHDFVGLLRVERDQVLDHERSLRGHPGRLRQDRPEGGQTAARSHCLPRRSDLREASGNRRRQNVLDHILFPTNC